MFGSGSSHNTPARPENEHKKLSKEFYWRQDVTKDSTVDPEVVRRDRVVLRNNRSGYYLDPQLVATRIVKLIGCYDKIADVSKIKLTTQWHELGLDEIDVVNLSVAIEMEFSMEFPDEEIERFKNVEDVVNYVARSFHAK